MNRGVAQARTGRHTIHLSDPYYPMDTIRFEGHPPMNESQSAELAQLRYEYTQSGLQYTELAADPITQFGTWYAQAHEAGLLQPNAMTVATVNAEGQPSLRTVLLKSYDRNGFVFYTNYESRKATDLAGNPRVALHFLWVDLERQIEIRGRAERIAAAESLRYFLTRPRGSQLGAWISPQSRVIDDRSVLETEFERMKAKMQDRELSLPSHWGGFRIRPDHFEFWQGRTNRLHDRFQYVADGDSWRIERLAP